MEHSELTALAARMAERHVLCRLKARFVHPAEAERRLKDHRANNTVDWIAQETAMLDALLALKGLGYSISPPAR